MNVILQAAAFARQAHAGQQRKYGGGPYILHPARVAARVALLPEATEAMVAAAFLHDVLEDTGAGPGDLETQFGGEITGLVKELTNPSKGMAARRAERKRLDRSHLATVSKAAKLIKLADRIDNLRDLRDADCGFQKLYAEESLALVAVIGDADAGLKDELIGLANRILQSAGRA